MRQGRTSAPEASPAPSSAPSRRCDARWLSRRISSFRARDENRDRGASCPLATQASLPAQTSSSHCLQYLRGAPRARARRGGTRGRHQKGQPRALRAEQPLRHRVLQLRRQLVEQLVVELHAKQALRRLEVFAHAVDGRRRHLVLLEEVAERVRRHLEVVRRRVRVAQRVREVRDEVAHEEQPKEHVRHGQAALARRHVGALREQRAQRPVQADRVLGPDARLAVAVQQRRPVVPPLRDHRVRVLVAALRLDVVREADAAGLVVDQEHEADEVLDDDAVLVLQEPDGRAPVALELDEAAHAAELEERQVVEAPQRRRAKIGRRAVAANEAPGHDGDDVEQHPGPRVAPRDLAPVDAPLVALRVEDGGVELEHDVHEEDHVDGADDDLDRTRRGRLPGRVAELAIRHSVLRE